MIFATRVCIAIILFLFTVTPARPVLAAGHHSLRVRHAHHRSRVHHRLHRHTVRRHAAIRTHPAVRRPPLSMPSAVGVSHVVSPLAVTPAVAYAPGWTFAPWELALLLSCAVIITFCLTSLKEGRRFRYYPGCCSLVSHSFQLP